MICSMVWLPLVEGRVLVPDERSLGFFLFFFACLGGRGSRDTPVVLASMLLETRGNEQSRVLSCQALSLNLYTSR